MQLRLCPKCNKNLSSSEFYIRKSGLRKGKHYEKCKNCMKLRGKNYYHQNHKRQLKLAIERRKKAFLEKRIILIKIKNKPCMDCGLSFPPYVMDFDHRNKTTKVTNIGTMSVNNWSLKRIMQEVKKCDIVCANCHRIRTYKDKYAGIAKVVTAGL